MKPMIFVAFYSNGCAWVSTGWGNDPDLAVKARDCIRRGDTPEQVVELLEDANFIVTVTDDVERLRSDYWKINE